MNEPQRLFLLQARSGLAVFDLLGDQAALPQCHALHYLQIATELLGKARAWRHGRPRQSHHAFTGFLRSLSTNRNAQQKLGYEGRNKSWKHLIRQCTPLAEAIEYLAPALAEDGPNPEYPWPPRAPRFAPVGHDFAISSELQTPKGLQFLKLLRDLFATAEAYL